MTAPVSMAAEEPAAPAQELAEAPPPAPPKAEVFHSPVAEPVAVAAEPPAKSGTMRIVAAVIVVIVVVGGWFGYRKFAGGTPQSAPQPIATQTPGPSPAQPNTPAKPMGGMTAAPSPVTTVPGPDRRTTFTPAKPTPAKPQQPPRSYDSRTTTTPPPPARQRATSGVIIWYGKLEKGSLITLDGKWTNRGDVTGELPGIPVAVELEPDAVGVAEAPSPSNGWKRITFRCRKGKFSQVTIRWRAL